MPAIVDQPLDPTGSTNTADTTAEMMLLFDRLLTSGALYPAGHINFTDAYSAFRNALDTLGSEGFVIIEAGTRLRIGADVLEPGVRGVGRVAGLMEKLGLHRITVLPDATETALHDLATGLLGHQREADETGHLAEADFANLPDSVQVVPKVFAKQWAEAGAASIGEAVDAILDELSARGTAEDLLQSCRSTLQDLFEVLMAKDRDLVLPVLDPATRPQDCEVADRLSDGARTLGGALRNMMDRDGDLARLAEAIQEAADDLNTGIDRNAAQMLLRALGGRNKSDYNLTAVDAEPRCLSDDSEYDLPLVELRAELATFEALDEVFVTRPLSEDLHICLTVLGQGTSSLGGTRALADITRILRAWPDPEQDPELQGTVRSLLMDGDHDMMDPVIERMAAIIRERGSEAIVAFWDGVCSARADGLHAALWPHLICEFLVAPTTARESMRALQTLATNPRALADPANLARLERLHVFGEVRGGADFFGRPERRYFPVYATLLGTSRGASFGAWLRKGLRKTSPDRQISAITNALGPYNHNQVRMCQAWLLSAAHHGDAPAVEVLDVLRSRLANLKADQRNEPWVVEIIEILGAYCPASARRLLENIAARRRLLLFKAWPAAAREAAKQALAAAEAARLERREDT